MKKETEKKTPEKKSADKHKGLGRKIGHSALSMTLTIVVIAAVVLANVVVTMFFDRYPLTVDMTGDQRYTISEQSLEYVKKINTDVKVTVFADEKTFENFNYPYNKQASELLKNYCRENHKISYRFVDMDSNPDIVRSYSDIKDMDIVFETETEIDGKKLSRTRKIGVSDLVNFNEQLVEGLSNSGFTIESYARKNLDGSQAMFIQYFASYISSSNAESAFTSALMTVTDPKPVYVTFLTGRNELGDLAYMKTLLEANGYNVNTVDITKDDIPEDTDIAVIGAPQTDYMQPDIDKLEKYMDNGGRQGKQIVCFSHAAQGETPLLDKLLAKYGLKVGEGIVCENREDRYYNQPYYTLSTDISEYLLSEMDVTSPSLLIAQSRPVETVETGNASLDIYKLFTSSDSGFTAETQALVNGETKVLKNEKQCYAALSIDQSTGSGIALFGTSSIAEDQFMAYGQYANKDMMLTLFGKMTGKSPEIKIEPKVIAAKGFEITEAQKKTLKWIFVLGVPLVVASVGIVITVRRKRR